MKVYLANRQGNRCRIAPIAELRVHNPLNSWWLFGGSSFSRIVETAAKTSSPFTSWEGLSNGGMDGTRTRDLLRDRQTL
jgi:hypothetical protein